MQPHRTSVTQVRKKKRGEGSIEDGVVLVQVVYFLNWFLLSVLP